MTKAGFAVGNKKTGVRIGVCTVGLGWLTELGRCIGGGPRSLETKAREVGRGEWVTDSQGSEDDVFGPERGRPEGTVETGCDGLIFANQGSAVKRPESRQGRAQGRDCWCGLVRHIQHKHLRHRHHRCHGQARESWMAGVDWSHRLCLTICFCVGGAHLLVVVMAHVL